MRTSRAQGERSNQAELHPGSRLIPFHQPNCLAVRRRWQFAATYFAAADFFFDPAQRCGRHQEPAHQRKFFHQMIEFKHHDNEEGHALLAELAWSCLGARGLMDKARVF